MIDRVLARYYSDRATYKTYEYKIECIDENDEWRGINGDLERLLEDCDQFKTFIPIGSEKYDYYFLEVPTGEIKLEQYLITDVKKRYFYRILVDLNE